MPDGSSIGALAPPATTQPKRFRPRWVSPLLRRILLVNALPLALLVAALLYLDQYQNGLLEAEVAALREQARIFAGALGESAVRTTDPDNPKLVPDIARPLLRRLTDPTPDAEAKLYAPDGTVIADSPRARRRRRRGRAPSRCRRRWNTARCSARSAGSTTASCRCCRTTGRSRWSSSRPAPGWNGSRT